MFELPGRLCPDLPLSGTPGEAGARLRGPFLLDGRDNGFGQPLHPRQYTTEVGRLAHDGSAWAQLVPSPVYPGGPACLLAQYIGYCSRYTEAMRHQSETGMAPCPGHLVVSWVWAPAEDLAVMWADRQPKLETALRGLWDAHKEQYHGDL